MDANPNRNTPAADGEPASPPYPLQPGTIELWLRRGDGLGRAALRTAMIIASLRARALAWRQAAAEAHDRPPPQLE